MREAANPYHKIPMDRREAGPGERIFTFKVIQSDREGKVRGHPYRTLLIPERITLFEFAGEICRAFRFGFDHMFGFYSNLKKPYQSAEGYELFVDNPETADDRSRQEFEGVVTTPVNQAFRTPGKKMLFLFDYGDEWYFRVELKEIRNAERTIRYPRLEKSEGKVIPQYGNRDD
jgi:hypothetical protein